MTNYEQQKMDGRSLLLNYRTSSPKNQLRDMGRKSLDSGAEKPVSLQSGKTEVFLKVKDWLEIDSVILKRDFLDFRYQYKQFA